MNKIVHILISFLLLSTLSALGQMDPLNPYGGAYGGTDPFHQMSDPYSGNFIDQQTTNTGQVTFSTNAPSDAPTPIAPQSAQSLGLEIPSASGSEEAQAPPQGESGQMLMSVDESVSRSLSADMQMSYGGTQTSTVYRMIMPQGIMGSNKFYAYQVPTTVTGCNLYGYLPLWLQVSTSGQVWGYEWYPSGYLDVQYLGFANPGWHKRWFQGDTPGWHILQYYCNGWSNYIYIYVYGWGPIPGPSPSPAPSPGPWSGTWPPYSPGPWG